MRAMPPPNWPFKGHSMSSPVDLIVFHLLELDLPADDSDDRRQGPLRHRWNRKLLFHLTQEILPVLLHLDDNGASYRTRLHGPALLSKVWSTVKAFPAADCRVVGDIDALVALDLHVTQFCCLWGIDDDTWTPFGGSLMFFRNEFHPLFNTTMRKVGKCSPSAKCTGSSRGLTPKNRGEEKGAPPSHSSAPRSPAAMHGGEEQGAPPPRKPSLQRLNIILKGPDHLKRCQISVVHSSVLQVGVASKYTHQMKVLL
ncbi:uncharacterized protein [Aegilops tauschii subsp. strangulata]|uniref:DUF4378 domain-containing protein n=2 Tax=Aegilops tauschii subsp. strangulata TaxID=200361 RepID=A0A453G6W0_AEGTS|nr:uncharacterized protein LOC109748881 [Aegilops tauschii subsp. strangulata]XP_044358898.1 uncharacterized protein LOC123080092 isoform X1 [Triticum aestivum]XP_044358899.1 uncharacterized protein LOC123080092 isoform X1 [Triticum aestivum]XP_044358900.1 uncharacterized protein LOC123080092 isoform X1 [Triticum aestivum]XP_044358901.1 uncharacterized protein LOC123080092 isoform X1 [Triticum aestivum]XP_044358902.1 uncharacterized protein LOC123080092 isoform X1 [Triticum aestivum]XP_044358